MSKNSSTYPTVATIIGCPEQLTSTNGLVATPIGASGELQPPSGPYIEDTSQIKDPIQKALIDNICGKLPTRNTGESVKCKVCNVDCNGQAAYQSHLVGAKHAKKLKEQTMTEYLKLSFIIHHKESNSYSCTLCCATLNAVSQIGAHIEGQKHKTKCLQKGIGEVVINTTKNNSGETPRSRVDATPNLLFCATCNIHVNSSAQLEQHTSSKKHISKVNGRPAMRANASWRWKIRNSRPLMNGRPGPPTSRFQTIGSTAYPRISHNFVPAGAGSYRPY